MRKHVEVSRRAERDLRRIGSGRDRKPLDDALAVGLTAVPPPGNLDVKALEGRAPWLRLRVGGYRVLYRPLTREELAAVGARRGPLGATEGYLVERVVHRRDLDRAVATLP